jgi:hypothetical protein
MLSSHFCIRCTYKCHALLSSLNIWENWGTETLLCPKSKKWVTNLWPRFSDSCSSIPPYTTFCLITIKLHFIWEPRPIVETWSTWITVQVPPSNRFRISGGPMNLHFISIPDDYKKCTLRLNIYLMWLKEEEKMISSFLPQVKL